MVKHRATHCPDCGIPKEVEKFFISSKGYFSTRCKSCNQKFKNRNGVYDNRQYDWKWNGIDFTIEEYSEMLLSQNNVCKVCGRNSDKRRLAVDHDHITGRIRGLLCVKCNTTLGWVEKYKEEIKNYLE